MITEEQIKQLNKTQQEGKVHPYTCDRKGVNCQVEKNDGVLIATLEGWICPCGEYKQKIKI